MYGAEVYGARWVFLQFLPKFKYMVIDGTGGRIVLITPDFIQQFVAADYPVGILHQKLESLEFLRGQKPLRCHRA